MAMKHLLMALLFGATMFPAAQAQEERGDSTVRVIGWFFTGDTLVYNSSSLEAEVTGRDTIVTEKSWIKFRVCVVDSTKRGYLMEYTPLEVGMKDSTSVRGRLKLLSAREALGMKVLFRTDQNGAFQEVVNWKEVCNQMLGNGMTVIDALYKDNPTLPAKITKPEMLKELRELTERQFGSREKLNEAFVGMRMLFSYHGLEFPLGENERQSDEGKVSYVVTRGKLDGEEYSTDEEYQLYMSVNLPEQEGEKSTIYYDYQYFDDGWPRYYQITTEEESQGKKKLSQQWVVWDSKAWK